VQKVRLIYGLGAQDQTLNASGKVGFDDFFTANAATNLHWHVTYGRHHVANQIAITWHASKSPIQIDDMQTASALISPMRRHGNGIAGENGRVIHATLTQPHALTFLQINRWNKQHA
jgi:hypothetical protein